MYAKLKNYRVMKASLADPLCSQQLQHLRVVSNAAQTLLPQLYILPLWGLSARKLTLIYIAQSHRYSLKIFVDASMALQLLNSTKIFKEDMWIQAMYSRLRFLAVSRANPRERSKMGSNSKVIKWGCQSLVCAHQDIVDFLCWAQSNRIQWFLCRTLVFFFVPFLPRYSLIHSFWNRMFMPL